MLNNAQTPLLHIADISGSALFNADCMDILPLIPDKSVQLILADLPYGTTEAKWDCIIPIDALWVVVVQPAHNPYIPLSHRRRQ